MPSLQLSGLASGLDWKSLVDQLMNLERAPINRIEREQLSNTQRSNALKDLGTRLTSLKTAVTNLKDATLFSGRTISSGTSGSGWSLAASSGSAVGNYEIAVSRLATLAKREGADDITGGISATNDVSGVTLANIRTASVITAGKFTVNGQQVTVATTDSLADVFTAINTATGGAVAATYNATTDKITLTSGSEIVLGAANDTSNFLQVLKLANNGTNTTESSAKLGAASTNSTLASVGFNAAITAVDGSGDGSFTINGVALTYNVNTDSLSTVMKRINASSAGVTASYDAVNDRVRLTNNATGDLGMTLSESAGGLLGALGLTSGFTATRGVNNQFSVDGGPTLTSTSNSLDASAHGLSGLSITVNSETTQTITVGADTARMKERIDAFITSYNAVQTYIDDKSKVTSANGTVTAAVLSNNRDVQDWARQMRNLAFNSIPGLGDTIDRLDDLGISFDRDGKISVGNATKLDAALANNPTDVEAFFNTSSTGFASKFDTLLTTLIASGNSSQERLTTTNSSLDRQIADLERRLVQQRELLTNAFIAMESAQAKIQQQSTALTNAFAQKTS